MAAGERDEGRMNERCCLRTDRGLTESDEECNLEGRRRTELLAITLPLVIVATNSKR